MPTSLSRHAGIVSSCAQIFSREASLSMSQNTPSLPQGTRDFGPEIMVRRNYIFDTIRQAFQLFGYPPLETPAMEKTETLTGKYGDEGDKLIFRILDSGDYLGGVDEATLVDASVKEDNTAKNPTTKNSDALKQLTKGISGRALRYDLTVPFARYVVMNHNKITYPFKRSQIQTVWRADRPQKGRYREFYQCDADVVGSDSLLYELELVQLFDHVLTNLRIPSIIKINNRKILAGIAEIAGISARMMEMTITIDKLDKIGIDGVIKELRERNFSEEALRILQPFFDLQGDYTEQLNALSNILQKSEIGKKGLEELAFIFDQVQGLGLSSCALELDVTLARGLNYYTGAIFEVKVKDMAFGSICGGGRYDDLTGIFGLPGVSGVGISFGADRLYDVMMDLNLFQEVTVSNTQILVANFGGAEEIAALRTVQALRASGIRAEIYPDASKMKKQFKYADDRQIGHVLIIGEEENKKGMVQLKNMRTGVQVVCSLEEAIQAI
jgi:histidyl-tRNA synthetase